MSHLLVLKWKNWDAGHFATSLVKCFGRLQMLWKKVTCSKVMPLGAHLNLYCHYNHNTYQYCIITISVQLPNRQQFTFFSCNTSSVILNINSCELCFVLPNDEIAFPLQTVKSNKLLCKMYWALITFSHQIHFCHINLYRQQLIDVLMISLMMYVTNFYISVWTQCFFELTVQHLLL